MPVITINDRSDVVARIKPANGIATGLASPQEVDAPLYHAGVTYTAVGAKAANQNIALMYFREPVRLTRGVLYCDGAVATATADVGVIPAATLDDGGNLFDVLGDAIPIATAGAYELIGGLASGTGEPGNLLYDVPADSLIVVRLNTAGLADGDVLKLSLSYVKRF